MSKEEKFNELYEKLVSEYSQEMEKNKDFLERRYKKESKIAYYSLFVEILLMGLMVYTYFLSKEGTFSFFIPILIFIIIIVILAISVMYGRNNTKKYEPYKKKFKEKIISPIVKSFNQNLEYAYEKRIDENIYKEAEFEKYISYKSEDLIEGILENNCKFIMSELVIEGLEQYNGERKYTTLFKGLFVKVGLNKEFNTKLYLRRDIREKEKAFKQDLDKLRLQLDSQEFENIFNIYTSNKIVAMQLLTADIMEMLVKFNQEMKYEITIKDNNIYIRFFCGEMFEPPSLEAFAIASSMNTKSLDKNILYKYYKMLDFTFELTNKLEKIINELQY